MTIVIPSPGNPLVTLLRIRSSIIVPKHHLSLLLPFHCHTSFFQSREMTSGNTYTTPGGLNTSTCVHLKPPQLTPLDAAVSFSSVIMMPPRSTSQTCIVADFYGKSYFDGTLLVEPSSQSWIIRACSAACASCDSLTRSESDIDGPRKYLFILAYRRHMKDEG